MTEQRNGNGIWKFLAVGALSAFFGMGVRMFQEPKNVVTKDELPVLIRTYNPYTQDEKDIKNQLADVKARLDKIDEHLLHNDDHIIQLGGDVSDVAKKVGATAHPVVRPSN